MSYFRFYPPKLLAKEEYLKELFLSKTLLFSSGLQK